MSFFENLLYAITGKILENQPIPEYARMKLASEIVRIATAEIGVQEINGSNCGPRVNEYKAATTLDPSQPWPWCAAFVDWVVAEAMKSTGIKETPGFKRPTTAGAWALELWSLAQDMTTQTRRKPQRDIQPGDIIVFTFSHCGIAVTAPDSTGFFKTIEGNTDDNGSREGGAVLKRNRRTSAVRSRIRFLV